MEDPDNERKRPSRWFLRWRAEPSGNKGDGPAVWLTKEEAAGEAGRLMAKYPHLTVWPVRDRGGRA